VEDNILTLYDKIGGHYDTTRRADPYIVSRLGHYLPARSDGRYLDIGCGSGNYTIALHKLGLTISGIDISETMLKRARSKSTAIDGVRADASSLPFDCGSLNGITAVNAIHHFHSFNRVFAECFRVLKRGGRLTIFTSTFEQMKGYWLNEYFPEMMQVSMREMPARKQIETSLNLAGFHDVIWEPYSVQDDLQDFFLYVGKNKPEMYLSWEIRMGSSAFAHYGDSPAVEKGCEALSQDIQSGRIVEVMGVYAGRSDGDYSFIVAEK
jgi:SAM-dependent methyltransferase